MVMYLGNNPEKDLGNRNEEGIKKGVNLTIRTHGKPGKNRTFTIVIEHTKSAHNVKVQNFFPAIPQILINFFYFEKQVFQALFLSTIKVYMYLL